MPATSLQRLTIDGGFASFEIEDNGIGLPAKDRDRLTEPYMTTREKGTGLGLAIVERVMEEHGGELTLADATQLPGARVTLRLPLAQLTAQNAAVKSTATSTPDLKPELKDA